MTNDALPAPEVAALIAELIRTDPTLEPTFSGGRLVTGQRLEPSPVHLGVEFVRLVVYLPHPGPSIVCARTADGVVVLRNPDSMLELNRRIGLRLDSSDEVAAYLRVWFALVDPTRGRPIEAPDDLPWAPSLIDLPGMAEAMSQASALVHPMRIEPQGDGRFRVVMSVLERRTLQSRVLEVDADGSVEVITSTDVVRELPVKATVR